MTLPHTYHYLTPPSRPTRGGRPVCVLSLLCRVVSFSGLRILPARVPVGLTLTGGPSNPGSQRLTCAADAPRVQYVQAAPGPGVLPLFCAYTCTVCGPGQHPVSACTPTQDTQCGPLPAACTSQGQCAGLGLEDLPTTLPPSIASVNMSGNPVFAVNARTLALYPLLEAGDFSDVPAALVVRAPTACSEGHIANVALGVCVHGVWRSVWRSACQNEGCGGYGAALGPGVRT